MEKQEIFEGKSLKESLEAIRKGLEEDKAFLQLSMLDPDPDVRQAEEGRIQNVLALAGVMEEILSRFAEGDEIVVETAKEENRRFDENLERRKRKSGKPAKRRKISIRKRKTAICPTQVTGNFLSGMKPIHWDAPVTAIISNMTGP